MSDYGSETNVAAYVQHMTNAGVFDATTKPPLATVTILLNEICAQLNGWLAANGYVVPVTNANAKLVLDRYANLGTAGLCELTMRSSGYSKDDQNKRENKFLAEFYLAEAYIASGALSNLGAATIVLPGGLSGLRVGGVTKSGQRLRPIFKRRGFGNNPTAESPTGREPDYTGDP